MPNQTTLRPTLFIFAGMPGAGKSTLAKRLADMRKAAYLRIDTIEQGLRDICSIRVEGEGYRMAYRLAADNLRNGANVVADCCNPIALTRQEWQEVANSGGAAYLNIEVLCSDAAEHRDRVESRARDVSGLQLPSGSDLLSRDYEPWTVERVRIDTAGQAETASFNALLAAIQRCLA